MQPYLEKFFSLNCAGDVLNAAGPLKRGDQQIEDAMAVVFAMRSWVLKRPDTFTILDLNTNSGIVPILAAHFLPVKEAVGINPLPHARLRELDGVRNVTFADIAWTDISASFSDPDSATIMTCVRPSRKVAQDVLDLWGNTPSPYLVLVPQATVWEAPYKRMVKNLALRLSGDIDEGIKVSIHEDEHMDTPFNALILARYEGPIISVPEDLVS